MKDNGTVRISDSGATRDSSINKMELSKYICPEVIIAFGAYMLKHQIQSDGTKRTGDNHKKGFGNTPKETMDICFASQLRHTLDMWLEQDGFPSKDGIDEALGGVFFNVMDYWSALIKSRKESGAQNEQPK